MHSFVEDAEAEPPMQYRFLTIFPRFFEMEPKAAEVFSFGDGTKLDEDFYKSPRLTRHATHYMIMVDRAVGLLGPDIELLTDILLELGNSHFKFGVQASFYPPMGSALIATLANMLGDKFTHEIKDSWLECYQALAYDMIRAKNSR
jgi:hemoglobin-like flavoprotein